MAESMSVDDQPIGCRLRVDLRVFSQCKVIFLLIPKGLHIKCESLTHIIKGLDCACRSASMVAMAIAGSRRCCSDGGWQVGKDRVERIWRREGLKVPQKQKPRGRLWLNDGSCVRLRPQQRQPCLELRLRRAMLARRMR